jgi:hypothetical protein
MIILTFSGKAESGKDTAASIFKRKIWEKYNKKSLIIHNADYLKFICKEYFGWDGKKDLKGRTLLQQLGTEIVRIQKKCPNFWVDTISYFMSVFEDDYDYFLIPDTRYENEISVLQDDFNFNVLTLHIERPFHENSLTSEQKNHPSENALNDYHFNYEIINLEGLENLEKEVDVLISWMKENNYL